MSKNSAITFQEWTVILQVIKQTQFQGQDIRMVADLMDKVEHIAEKARKREGADG